MANPAPTINQINAFNATQGTTIDFNIIGGTELVRSNRIYIYDLSDNSLICTHLYVSTESIHELPPNTDGSIVYESGKSSADFVNGAQYYAQIQTFTDIAGTEGGSGLSVAKMFWCLVDPTLTITTIPSTISTTSYNVSATYNANTSVVSNIIQQYQFSLYSAIGSLLQSSGVVVGSGTQQGTSTAYDISYNFTGLSVGSSYYVVVDVTTTQGMSVSVQSNTFTVSIDTPTLGEATVVNNACDGYISVTSNLSSEYGGSGSGEIVSFETDSENVFTKLQVDLDPIQSGSGTPSPSNVRPISGHDDVEVGVVGKNLFGGIEVVDALQQSYSNIVVNTANESFHYSPTSAEGYKQVVGIVKTVGKWFPFKENTQYTFIIRIDPNSTNNYLNLGVAYTDGTNNGGFYPASADSNGWIVFTTPVGKSVRNLYGGIYTTTSAEIYYNDFGIFEGVVTKDQFETYNGQTYTDTLPSTTYGGTLDLVSGVLTAIMPNDSMIDLGTLTWTMAASGQFTADVPNSKNLQNHTKANALCSAYQVLAANAVGSTNCSLAVGLNSRSMVYVHDDSYADAQSFKTAMNGVQLCYELATPLTYQLTPQQIQTLVGVNNVWSEQGDVELSYHIPITNLLVKRQDVADVSGDWLILYSQPITQASDMDFTFIDFTNQYGKTYKYALVPLLTQTQSGVEVEVEGGYTVSDEVQSVFDGVFIADSTGSQKCKANVGYGNVDMNQAVGTITPIGAKYPVVITNSQNQYHNGSISGTIVPDDYYFNGNLSRIDMVNKRDELEQFLTNKRAKIIKDWNGKIWLVMIMDNVNCTFNNNYGMGIVNFSTNWVEVGDPTNQEDLQATGLINVGGV